LSKTKPESAIAEAFLTSLGYNVLRASDGPQALRILSAGPPVSILFTDLVLPAGLSGQQIGEAARRLNPRIKVLFTSGYPTDALMSQGRIEPGAVLLQKPYRRSELVEALRKLQAQ
jgi:CheY-like chemotaxis protein